MEPRDAAAHEALAELVELAPVGGLAPGEHRRVAEHLDAGCPACAERHARGLEALDALALAAPPAALAAERRDALLAAVAPGRQRDAGRRPRRSDRRAIVSAWAAGLALAVAAGSLFAALHVERAAEDAVRAARARLEARIALGDRRVEALAARLERFEAAVRASGPRARELPLDATSRSVTASARVVVDPEGDQVLLLASRLSPAPPGHTYQLWVIESGAPRSVGVFEPDAGGRVLHVEAAPGGLAGEFSVAVSVEPAGGVPQPTGPIVLASH